MEDLKPSIRGRGVQTLPLPHTQRATDLTFVLHDMVAFELQYVVICRTKLHVYSFMNT